MCCLLPLLMAACCAAAAFELGLAAPGEGLLAAADGLGLLMPLPYSCAATLAAALVRSTSSLHQLLLLLPAT
jgi:hypothetical protein